MKDKATVETGRLIIRPYRLADGDAVWRVVSREEIYRTTYAIPRDYPRSRVDWWIAYVENARKHGTGYEFGMFEKDGGAYVGNCGLINVNPNLQSAAITYHVAPERWGRGYATEGTAAMLLLAFEGLGLYRVSGRCMRCNPASRRVMEKLGFLYEGTGRAEIYKDGVFLDVDHLALLRGEWNRSAMEPLLGFSTTNC
jgi:ribosomal-protein-alanine N-acetyltransferase